MRTTSTLAAALFATCLVIPAAAPALAQDAGKTAYDKRCARCHTIEQAVGFLHAHPDAAERAQWLENKLSRHHARDARDRAAIIAFLEDALAKMK